MLTISRDRLLKDKKVIKFHGDEVENVTILYSIRPNMKPITTKMEEFDALKRYQESTNSIMSRELIPLHATEHLWVKDLP